MNRRNFFGCVVGSLLAAYGLKAAEPPFHGDIVPLRTPAKGGLVPGNNNDTIPAMLLPGYCISRGQAKKYPSILHSINKAKP